MNEIEQSKSVGRVSQKARTRAALLASALNLIRQGQRPTVEEAALAVGISKRTAYRYFVSQDHMLADAALDGLRVLMDAIFANSTLANADAHFRLARLAAAVRELGEKHEPELRTMMRAALDMSVNARRPAAPARGGRRLEWIKTAVEPVKDRLSTDAYGQLVAGLAVCIGIDALIVLRDVCGLLGDEAEDVMRWSATALLDRALAATN
jgi:AcrR family transcriptional regulator